MADDDAEPQVAQNVVLPGEDASDREDGVALFSFLSRDAVRVCLLRGEEETFELAVKERLKYRWLSIIHIEMIILARDWVSETLTL